MDKASQSKLDSIKKLKEKFNHTLPVHLDHLKQLIDEMDGEAPEETLKAFKIKVHELAGIAGIFGYKKAGELIGNLDRNVSEKIDHYQSLPFNQNWSLEFSGFIEKIETAFQEEKS